MEPHGTLGGGGPGAPRGEPPATPRRKANSRKRKVPVKTTAPRPLPHAPPAPRPPSEEQLGGRGMKAEGSRDGCHRPVAIKQEREDAFGDGTWWRRTMRRRTMRRRRINEEESNSRDKRGLPRPVEVDVKVEDDDEEEDEEEEEDDEDDDEEDDEEESNSMDELGLLRPVEVDVMVEEEDDDEEEEDNEEESNSRDKRGLLRPVEVDVKVEEEEGGNNEEEEEDNEEVDGQQSVSNQQDNDDKDGEVHIQVRRVSCPLCARQFLCHSVLQNHLRSRHSPHVRRAPAALPAGAGKRHLCPLCPYGSNFKASVRIHPPHPHGREAVRVRVVRGVVRPSGAPAATPADARPAQAVRVSGMRTGLLADRGPQEASGGARIGDVRGGGGEGGRRGGAGGGGSGEAGGAIGVLYNGR
ncbi:uncharacterized protein LOC144740827 [Lampetra planeri]